MGQGLLQLPLLQRPQRVCACSNQQASGWSCSTSHYPTVNFSQSNTCSSAAGTAANTVGGEVEAQHKPSTTEQAGHIWGMTRFLRSPCLALQSFCTTVPVRTPSTQPPTAAAAALTRLRLPPRLCVQLSSSRPPAHQQRAGLQVRFSRVFQQGTESLPLRPPAQSPARIDSGSKAWPAAQTTPLLKRSAWLCAQPSRNAREACKAHRVGLLCCCASDRGPCLTGAAVGLNLLVQAGRRGTRASEVLSGRLRSKAPASSATCVRA